MKVVKFMTQGEVERDYTILESEVAGKVQPVKKTAFSIPYEQVDDRNESKQPNTFRTLHAVPALSFVERQLESLLMEPSPPLPPQLYLPLAEEVVGPSICPSVPFHTFVSWWNFFEPKEFMVFPAFLFRMLTTVK